VTEAGATRLIDALRTRADELVERLDADACVLSRVLGDVLVIVTQATLDGVELDLGQGFLVSDYPLTRRVLERGEPATLTVAEESADEEETRLLRELGFAALLMTPLEVAGERWGLVEVYRRDARPFGADAVEVARGLARI
jgi:GAF domain-containing protein